jgi:hypothetical protein
MRYNKTFTVEDAKRLLPQVRQMILDANAELEQIIERLKVVDDEFQEAENEVGKIKTTTKDPGDLTRLRECRAQFQESGQRLSAVKHEYEECLMKWIEKITDLGIVLRDLATGLIDFPAEKGDTQYLLCWRLDDTDIDYWHLPNDGFIGRRPLAVLDEYF